MRFEFVLRQLFVILAPAVLGRRDGSIRALRKVRIRNETDNFIESISQMVPRWSPEVPRWSPEVPDGPRRSPKPITSCGRSPKPITSCGRLCLLDESRILEEIYYAVPVLAVLICFQLFFDIPFSPTTTFLNSRSSDTRKLRRIDPRTPEGPDP